MALERRHASTVVFELVRRIEIRTRRLSLLRLATHRKTKSNLLAIIELYGGP